MNYNDDWREERRRHNENPFYNPRWENRNERQRSNDSGYWNNEEYATPHSRSYDRSGQQYESNWHGEQNARRGRNPNWDQNAPSSSMYEGRNQFQDSDYPQSANYGNAYQPPNNQNRPNRNYDAQGMTDPRYGNPRFSDRERRGTMGGSSDRYERGNYGDYTDYRSSGQQFDNAPQGRYGSHTEDWNTDDYRTGKSLGRRDLRNTGSEYAGGSHRGKGPKNYKRDDSRIKDDVNDALTDHHNIDASDISVEVTNGNVILSGHVDDRQAKREAEYAIDYISGVSNVENRIHVKSETISSSSWNSDSDNRRSDDDKKSSSDSAKSRNAKTTA